MKIQETPTGWKLDLQLKEIFQRANIHVDQIRCSRIIRDDIISVFTTTRVVCEELGRIDVTFQYSHPATWWDMLKKQRAPRWFLRRWPVRYKHIEEKRQVDAAAAFPDYVVPPRDVLALLGEPVLSLFEHGPKRKETTDASSQGSEQEAP